MCNLARGSLGNHLLHLGYVLANKIPSGSPVTTVGIAKTTFH